MFKVSPLLQTGMKNHFLEALLLLAIALGASSQALAGASVLLPLNPKQQAILGIQVSQLQSSSGAQLLVSASVVTPPGKEFTISAPYAGQISRLFAGVGDSFKVGAPLAQFTSPMLGDARRLLNEASIDYKNAKAAAERDQAMFDEGIIPAVRLQLTRSKQEAALAQLHAREAELSVSGTSFEVGSGYSTGTLKAPVSGTVLEAFTAVGQRVEAGTVLFKLADASQLQLDLQLSSDKAAQIQVGDEVSLVARSAKAKIIGVSRAVDSSQLARARAVVTTRGSLQAGELVSVMVQARGLLNASKGSDRWLVPTRAVTQWKGEPFVFVANEQGFEAKHVLVISSTDDMSIVEVSMPLGAKVAITGIASLRAMLQKDE
jgi:RND family efflux transporter MFP subunit